MILQVEQTIKSVALATITLPEDADLSRVDEWTIRSDWLHYVTKDNVWVEEELASRNIEQYEWDTPLSYAISTPGVDGSESKVLKTTH